MKFPNNKFVTTIYQFEKDIENYFSVIGLFYSVINFFLGFFLSKKGDIIMENR